MIPIPYKIEKRIQETTDTFTLVLKPSGSSRVEAISPGQFNMVTCFGVGEVAISISEINQSSSNLSRTHTIRAVGDVTRTIERLKEGDEIGLRGPFGRSWPTDVENQKTPIIVAGGLGIAPLRPLIHQCLTHLKKEEKLFVIVGARTPKDFPFLNEIKSWKKIKNLDLRITVDLPDEDWKEDVGFVTRYISNLDFVPSKSRVYTCGPEPMMKFVAEGFIERSVPASEIFVSLERNMKCAYGVCGHCIYGPKFICRDGPVFSYEEVRELFKLRGL